VGGCCLLANSPGHVGLFDCDRDTTGTISCPQQGKDVLSVTGVVLTSEVDVGTRPPGPLGCLMCQKVSRRLIQLRQLLLDIFHERQGRERVARIRQTP
jgi:hypothetical protein